METEVLLEKIKLLEFDLGMMTIAKESLEVRLSSCEEALDAAHLKNSKMREVLDNLKYCSHTVLAHSADPDLGAYHVLAMESRAALVKAIEEANQVQNE